MGKALMSLALLLAVFTVPALGHDKPTYPTPAPPADASDLGKGVQRTMNLLATSTPQHRNHVRVLFYGQSITEQSWSKAVADDLRRRFPDADLEIENRAIGGFASQRLIRPAEHDLYPFYPDLLVFHVYGSNQEYEQIIQNVRSRTTAEVLMQRDHLTKWVPANPDREADKGLWWDNLMNTQLLPEIANKYGCGLADVRGGWVDYLKANRLEPKDLLKDGVHLNDHGNYLMAELVKRYLVYRPDLPRDEWKDPVRTYEVGKDFQWKDGKLTLPFEGNRVDAIAAEGGAGQALEVRIDGKKPSEYGDLYRITRPQPGPWSPLFVMRVGHERPLAAEDWTLTVTNVSGDSEKWEFEVAGSVTGPDGSGSNGQTFVSKSGRVKIEAADWFRNGKVPAGYQSRWSALPTFVDRYEVPKAGDPSREAAATLLQGVSNGRHTLELVAPTGGVPSAVKAIRVYRPPYGRE